MRVTVASASIWMLASCSEPARTQDPVFERAAFSSHVVGRGSGKVLLADLNGDKRLDLVTQHLLDSVVNVHLGDGTGRFAPAAGSPLKLSYQPGTIALGDVNNDNIPDLAIANKDAKGEYVNILLSDGRGGFGKTLGARFRASHAMEFYKPILRLADINRDGNSDIVMANGRRPTIEVLLGNGAGAFAVQPVVSLGHGTGIGSFAIGDVDGDGHDDIVACNSGGSELDTPGHLITKRGAGNGSFTDASPAPLPLPPGAILEALTDVNGDSRLDAVFTHGDRNALSVYVNNGRGTFAASTETLQFKGHAFAVLVADLNGDRNADLITTTVESVPFYSSNVAVFLGGSRGFVPAPGSPFASGPGAYNLALGDINQDGQLDVVSSSFEGNAVTILIGRAKR